MNIKIKDILLINPDHTTQVANIFIVGERIAHIGVNAPKDFMCDFLIDGKNKLAVPGFINTHTHAYMSGFRNWVDDFPTHDLIFNRIASAEDRLTPDDAYPLALLSILEMIQSGITCFVDMHKFPEASITAANDVNITAVVARMLSGQDKDEISSKKQLAEAIQEYQDFKYHGHIHFMLAPHSVYKCGKEYLSYVSKVAEMHNLGVHIHLSESKKEVIDCLGNYHETPVKLAEKCGLLSKSTIAAHCVHLSEEDFKILVKNKVNVSVNTCSDLKLGYGIAPVVHMKDLGMNLCLGTEGIAYNNSLNMLREMQFTSLIHKGSYQATDVITAHDVFDMATINGARALGLQKEIGQLSRGYKADIAIFDLDEISLTPLGDPISALCYSSTGLQADTVICNGQVVLYNKEFTDIDIFKLKDQVVQTITDKIYQITD